MWLTKSRGRFTQPPISRFSGKRIASATGPSSTSVDPSERASSEAATVGDGVVARDSCNGRKMSRLIGSSPLSTAGGRGPFNLIA